MLERVDEIDDEACLADEAPAPSTKCLDGVFLSFVHGHEDDPSVRREFLKPIGDLETVESRHDHVQDDEVGFEPLSKVYRLMTIRRSCHDVEVRRQKCGDVPQYLRMIIDDEHARSDAGGPPVDVRCSRMTHEAVSL